MRDNFVVFCDEIDDLHREIGKRLPERADPTARRRGDVSLGNLVEYTEVTRVDDLADEPANELLVVLGAHDAPRGGLHDHGDAKKTDRRAHHVEAVGAKAVEDHALGRRPGNEHAPVRGEDPAGVRV